jgi:hypothetical protein
VSITTGLPSIKDTLVNSYSLAYKLTYGLTVGKWKEENLVAERHTSKFMPLNYVYSSQRQQVCLPINLVSSFLIFLVDRSYWN